MNRYQNIYTRTSHAIQDTPHIQMINNFVDLGILIHKSSKFALMFNMLLTFFGMKIYSTDLQHSNQYIKVYYQYILYQNIISYILRRFIFY